MSQKADELYISNEDLFTLVIAPKKKEYVVIVKQLAKNDSRNNRRRYRRRHNERVIYSASRKLSLNKSLVKDIDGSRRNCDE